MQTLLPWLSKGGYRVKPDGNLEFSDAEPAEAIKLLRAHVERALPEDVRERLGTRSGLGWNVFFGHVVAWWLPLRGRVGLLRALVDRAALHRVELRLHWNEDRLVAPVPRDVGESALWWGLGTGAVAGLAATQLFRVSSVFALLIAGAGLFAGRIYDRLGLARTCGDPLCRQPLSVRQRRCPSCGARLR